MADQSFSLGRESRLNLRYRRRKGVQHMLGFAEIPQGTGASSFRYHSIQLACYTTSIESVPSSKSDSRQFPNPYVLLECNFASDRPRNLEGEVSTIQLHRVFIDRRWRSSAVAAVLPGVLLRLSTDVSILWAADLRARLSAVPAVVVLRMAGLLAAAVIFDGRELMLWGEGLRFRSFRLAERFFASC